MHCLGILKNVSFPHIAGNIYRSLTHNKLHNKNMSARKMVWLIDVLIVLEQWRSVAQRNKLLYIRLFVIFVSWIN